MGEGVMVSWVEFTFMCFIFHWVGGLLGPILSMINRKLWPGLYEWKRGKG
jgi:hypothetical protein